MISVQAARDIVLAQIPALGTERQGYLPGTCAG